jgi:hemolysin III
VQNVVLKKPSIAKREDHTHKLFFKRTIAAQIHLLGLIAAIVGLTILLYLTWGGEDRLQFWACATFGCTAILVFAMSSTYHFLADGLEISARLEQIFEDLDHFSIYLFIAGTYTPVMLNTLTNKTIQYAMLGSVWLVAFLGIAYTHSKPRLPQWARSRFFSTGIFVLMGWIALLRIRTIFSHISYFGMLALVLGGLSYTVGAIIYATKRPVLVQGIFGFHELWHIMVLLGFVFHYLVVLNFYYAF